MYSLTLAILLVLIGILITRVRVAHLRQKKLPPGPTPFPIIGSLHLLGTLPHRALHKLSQKYGPIMSIRLGSIPFVIVSSPEAAKLFLGTHDAVFASRPCIQAAEYFGYERKGLLFAEYGSYWRSVRKFYTLELLGARKINGFAGMRREEMRLMVEEIRVASMERKVVNLSERVGVLTEGMTCRMIFGKKFDERFGFMSIVNEGMDAVGKFNLADYVPMLAPFDLQGSTKHYKSFHRKLDEMLEALINEHEERNLIRSQTAEEMDFIDTLLSLKHQYSNTHNDLSFTIDRSGMKSILVDMLAGGIDTVKTSIEWVLAVLIKHPRVMKKLQQELKDVIGDKLVVEETDLTNLTYLHMVVKETFRLYPVAPLFPHQAMEDIVINSYNIPKNTRVLVNYWAFGRDPKVWSENWPEEFLPERFLETEIDFRGADNYQLIQFSTGRRGCPGMNLGLLSTGLVVSNIVHCFDWELPDDMSPSDLDMNEKFGLTTPRVKPLLAKPIYRG